MLLGPPEYPADLLSRCFRGGECAIRLSLGKLSVKLLQVDKRTNTQLIPARRPTGGTKSRDEVGAPKSSVVRT